MTLQLRLRSSGRTELIIALLFALACMSCLLNNPMAQIHSLGAEKDFSHLFDIQIEEWHFQIGKQAGALMRAESIMFVLLRSCSNQ